MAVRLGWANVDALGRSLTAKQFLEWEAYARLEPFNELRADYRAASIATMIANVNRDAKKHPKAYVLEDFVLKYEEKEQGASSQPWQQKLAIAQAICMAYAAKAKES
jgi:hypothetical protein